MKGILEIRTNKEMCEKIDLKCGTLNTWINRGNIPKSRLFEIAHIINVDVMWLKTGLLLPSSNNDLVRPTNISPSEYKAMHDTVEIDQLQNGDKRVGDRVDEPNSTYGREETISLEYYPEVYASAGGGAMVYESLAHTEPMKLSKSFVEDFLGITTQKNMHILNVKGDSMEPTILDGELIFVLPLNGDGIVDGNIYVMMYKDEIYVKRVRREAFTGTYKLSSDNEDVGDIKLTEEQSNDCQIIGEVVGQMRRKG